MDHNTKQEEKPKEASAVDGPADLRDVFKIFPKDAIQLRVGFAFFTLARVWITCILAVYLIYVAPWYLVPLAWVFCGTAWTGLFVLGHECAHGSFTRNRLVNEIVGTACMMPLMFPYNCWELTHNHHHSWANNMGKDHLWKPFRAEELNKMSTARKYLTYYLFGPLFFETSLLHHAYHFLLPVVSSKNRLGVVRSILFAALGAYLSLSLASYYGSIFKLYVVPFLIFQFWLSTFTYFHHKHPAGVGWKDDAEWNRLYGSLYATVHVDYPSWIEYLTLDINWHLPHHVSPLIPWYNLRRCTYALFKAYGDKMQSDEFSLSLWKETTTQCHIFDKEKGIFRCIVPSTGILAIVMRVFGVFWVSLLLLYTAQAGFWDTFFNPRLNHAPKFAGSGFFNVSIGLTDVKGHVGCFGDFNSDRYTDIFVVDETFRYVSVLLWDTNIWKFIPGPRIESSLHIISVAATDFDYDGRLDLLVQGKLPSDLADDPVNNVNLEWYRGDYQNLSFVAHLNSSAGEVIIVDSNTDMVPDLLGQRFENGTWQRSYWRNSPPGTFTIVAANDLHPELELFLDHSNAFVDLDGDCLADLVLKSGNGTYQFFKNTKDAFSSVWKSDMTADSGAGHLTFADFDSDGAVDVMFPVCNPPGTCELDNSIHVIYNVQQRVCQGAFDTNCLSETGLCTYDPNWQLSNFTSPGSGSVVIVSKDKFDGSVFYSNSQFPQVKIRTGDYDLDGFPDLIFTTIRPNQQSKVELWHSVLCTTQLGCSADAVAAGRRTFQYAKPAEVLALYDISGAYAATFFDFDEDGTNDIIVLANNGSGLHMFGVFNNLNPDAYFFKTLGLNGVCTQWCPGFPDPRPYGVNQHGASLKFTYSDMMGYKRAPSVPQLAQSSHLALQTPYTLSGLGRPANYIQYFYLGVTVKSDGHWFSWPGIIPNSQVVAIPYPLNTPDSWRAELYLSLSGTAVWIIIGVVGCLIVMGVIVGILSYKEKKQDEREKKEKEHLFSFKAL